MNTHIPKGLIIKKSLRQGLGIFTKTRFEKDEVLFEVTGRFIKGDADDDVDEETQSNAFRYDENRYIDPQHRIGKFLNHSCNPNAYVSRIGKHLFVKAATTITPGREVLIDYSTILASDDVWTLKCNCGSTKCRKVIRRFDTLPKKLRESYSTRGIVPEYILNI